MARVKKRISHRCGDKVCFHGAFAKKSVAEAKKARVKGARIISTFVGPRGSDHRYLVVTSKKKR